jgi:hypothetical protein
MNKLKMFAIVAAILNSVVFGTLLITAPDHLTVINITGTVLLILGISGVIAACGSELLSWDVKE